MLIKCSECELQVSDKAMTCPHCGYPLKSDTGVKKKRTSNKRKRLPNGFGQISEIKNRNLRKPFRAMVCVGKNNYGKFIIKPLKPNSYFETYNDAYAALVEYNKNPYDLSPSITVQELYEEWSEKYFKNLTSDASIRTITSAWNYCSSIYQMRVSDLRARHIKGCMNEGYRIETTGKHKGERVYASASTKSRIKSLFNLMLDYAYEYEITDRNYARTFEISGDVTTEIEKNKQSHIIFTEDEISTLWDNVDTTKFADWILIQTYMGWRPQELTILKLSDIDLSKWTITGGMKTKAGKCRTVPIHTRIRNLVLRNYDFAKSINSEYLLNDKGQTHAGRWKITYDKYAARFDRVCNELHLNPDHRPHDPRKTFITMAKKANVDEYAIKAMVGHKANDITESTYTDRDIEWLRKDLEKIR